MIFCLLRDRKQLIVEFLLLLLTIRLSAQCVNLKIELVEFFQPGGHVPKAKIRESAILPFFIKKS